MGSVVISLDSGFKNTYFRIKRNDKFDTVLDNIKKYIQASKDNVIIKYIIVPGYNDNLKEIDKFFELMHSIGVNTVALDLEVQYARKYNNKEVSNHIFILNDYFEYKTKELNIKLLTYSFLSYVLKNRQFKATPDYIIKNNFLSGLYLMRHDNKSKRINY